MRYPLHKLSARATSSSSSSGGCGWPSPYRKDSSRGSAATARSSSVSCPGTRSPAARRSALSRSRASAARTFAAARRYDVVHRPAYTVHDLDRRKSSGLREVAVEDQVTVDQGAHRLRQRIVEPAVLGEDGRDQGDRAAACTSRALDELRELGKDARRIAAAPERFSVPECKL